MAKPSYLRNGKVFFTPSEWDTVQGDGTPQNPVTVILDGTKERIRVTGTFDSSNAKGRQWNNLVNGVTVEQRNAAGPTLVQDETIETKPDTTELTPEEKAKQAEIRGKAFGFMKQFLEKYPNDLKLQEAWALLLENDIAGAELAYKASQYYQDTLPESDRRLRRKLSQFGVYTKELNTFIDNQVRRLTLAGIRLDPNNPDVRTMLETAYDNAESDNQIDIKALAINTGKAIGGTTGGSIADLRAYARAFGMNYGDKDLSRWAEDVFTGRTTSFDIQAKIRQDAASMYPAYADAILNGESVDSLGSSFKSSLATILELDPDAIEWTDPTLKKAMQNVVNGKPAIMPNWQFEQLLRQDPRWQFTNNARDSVYNAVYQVKSDFGLI